MRSTSSEPDRRQLANLYVLLIILFVVVFWPSIHWVVSSLLREQTLRNRRLALSIPFSWYGDLDETRIVGWRPCLTRFCDGTRSSFELESVDLGLQTHEKTADGWLPGAKETLLEMGYEGLAVRVIPLGDASSFTCVEGVRESGGDYLTMVTCFAPEGEVVAGFEGVVKDVDEFFEILASAEINY